MRLKQVGMLLLLMLWMAHVLMVMHRKLRRKRGAVGDPLWLGPSLCGSHRKGHWFVIGLSSCVSCGTRARTSVRCLRLRDVSVER